MNFCLQKQDISLNENGIIINVKYQRNSYNNHHTHPLSKKAFLPRYNLLLLIENDLENFGSNTKVADLITFAKAKYSLDLKYKQAHHLLEQLDPKHKYGDAADFLLYLSEKNFTIYYELDQENRLNLLLYLSPFQKEIANRYAKVMFFDTIVNTNKYGRPRGTVTTQLNNGRLVPILHCILPNQETETFEKVFQIGIKRMLGPPITLLTDQDKAILKAYRNKLMNDSYLIHCNRHAKENTEKHITSLVSPNCYKDLSALEKIKSHSKIIGLFKDISTQKALADIEYLKNNLPSGEVKKYFVDNLLPNQSNLFPPFIETFSAGHFTTNPAESINHIIRGLRRSRDLMEESHLLFEKLPIDVSISNVKITKFQKSLIDSSPIFSPYKNTYTDYALDKILENFIEAQDLDAEKKENFIEVYKIATIIDDGLAIEYKKDVQKVILFYTKLLILGGYSAERVSLHMQLSHTFRPYM